MGRFQLSMKATNAVDHVSSATRVPRVGAGARAKNPAPARRARRKMSAAPGEDDMTPSIAETLGLLIPGWAALRRPREPSPPPADVPNFAAAEKDMLDAVASHKEPASPPRGPRLLDALRDGPALEELPLMAEPSLPARWDAAKELFAILSTSGTARSPPKTPECEAGAHFDEIVQEELDLPGSILGPGMLEPELLWEKESEQLWQTCMPSLRALPSNAVSLRLQVDLQGIAADALFLGITPDQSSPSAEAPKTRLLGHVWGKHWPSAGLPETDPRAEAPVCADSELLPVGPGLVRKGRAEPGPGQAFVPGKRPLTLASPSFQPQPWKRPRQAASASQRSAETAQREPAAAPDEGPLGAQTRGEGGGGQRAAATHGPRPSASSRREMSSEEQRALLSEVFGSSDKEADDTTLVVHGSNPAGSVPRKSGAARHVHGDLGRGGRRGAQSGAPARQEGYAATQIHMREAQPSPVMASCLADLKQSHDALWSAAANAGLHTPQPDFWQVDASLPVLPETPAPGTQLSAKALATSLLVLRQTAWCILNCGVHAGLAHLAKASEGDDKVRALCQEPLASLEDTAASVALGSADDHPWVPASAALALDMLLDNSGPRAMPCCALVCPRPGIPALMAALGCIRVPLSVRSVLDAQPLTPADLAPPRPGMPSVVVVSSPGQVQGCAGLLRGTVVLGELKAGCSWQWAQGIETHHLLAQRPDLSSCPGPDPSLVAHLTWTIRGPTAQPPTPGPAAPRMPAPGATGWAGAPGPPRQAGQPAPYPPARSPAEQARHHAHGSWHPGPPMTGQSSASPSAAPGMGPSSMPGGLNSAPRGPHEHGTHVPPDAPWQRMDPHAHVHYDATAAASGVLSPDGSTGVPACTIAVAVSAELSAICPALDDALAALDEPGVTVVDRAMPSGEALALDECTCLCMLMQPPSPKALWHAASALLPRTADRYSTCILVVQAASAAALSDQDPAIPGIQEWARSHLGLSVLVRVTYSAQATVDLAMHVLRGSLQAQRSRDAGPDVANADVMTPLEGRLAQPGFMNPVLALKAARLGDRALHSGRIGDLLPLAPRRATQLLEAHLLGRDQRHRPPHPLLSSRLPDLHGPPLQGTPFHGHTMVPEPHPMQQRVGAAGGAPGSPWEGMRGPRGAWQPQTMMPPAHTSAAAGASYRDVGALHGFGQMPSPLHAPYDAPMHPSRGAAGVAAPHAGMAMASDPGAGFRAGTWDAFSKLQSQQGGPAVEDGRWAQRRGAGSDARWAPHTGTMRHGGDLPSASGLALGPDSRSQPAYAGRWGPFTSEPEHPGAYDSAEAPVSTHATHGGNPHSVGLDSTGGGGGLVDWARVSSEAAMGIEGRHMASNDRGVREASSRPVEGRACEDLVFGIPDDSFEFHQGLSLGDMDDDAGAMWSPSLGPARRPWRAAGEGGGAGMGMALGAGQDDAFLCFGSHLDTDDVLGVLTTHHDDPVGGAALRKGPQRAHVAGPRLVSRMRHDREPDVLSELSPRRATAGHEQRLRSALAPEPSDPGPLGPGRAPRVFTLSDKRALCWTKRHPGRGRKVEDVRGPRHRASRSLELDSGGSLQDEFL